MRVVHEITDHFRRIADWSLFEWAFTLGACMVVSFLVILPFAFAPSHQEVIAPDGRPALAVRCGSPEGCVAHAGEVCDHGYDVLDMQSEIHNHTTTNMVGKVPTTTTHESWTGMLLVRCKQ